MTPIDKKELERIGLKSKFSTSYFNSVEDFANWAGDTIIKLCNTLEQTQVENEKIKKQAIKVISCFAWTDDILRKPVWITEGQTLEALKRLQQALRELDKGE